MYRDVRESVKKGGGPYRELKRVCVEK